MTAVKPTRSNPTTPEEWALGAGVLGVPARSTGELIARIGEGLGLQHLDHLGRRLDFLTQHEVLATVGISERTLARKRRDGTRLNVEQSERTVRLARVVEAAYASFGEERARTWLTSRWPALDHHTPLEYARSELGAAAVLDLIGSFDDGIFV